MTAVDPATLQVTDEEIEEIAQWCRTWNNLVISKNIARLVEAHRKIAPTTVASPRDMRFYFWKFVHNAVIHPMLSLPFEFELVQLWHDVTAKKCAGAG